MSPGHLRTRVPPPTGLLGWVADRVAAPAVRRNLRAALDEAPRRSARTRRRPPDPHPAHEVADMERRHDPAEFAAMLAGVDDATVEEQVVARDVDSVLAEIFEEMARRFLPERAGGRSAVVQYDIALRDGSVRTWQVSVAGGACTVRAGTESPAQVTVQMALPRFLRLLSGSLDPVAAFMSGDMRVRGDLVLAQLMQGWFDRT